MSTHPDPRARARPIFRRWTLVGATAVLAAGAVVVLLLQGTPDVETEAPAAVPRETRTSGTTAPSEVATGRGPRLRDARQPEDADPPAPQALSSQDLRRLFVATHLRPEDLGRVREVAATETDPERSALAAAILAENGDQEAIERLVAMLAEHGQTMASYLVFELGPDRALPLLRLARWRRDAPEGDQASRLLAILLGQHLRGLFVAPHLRPEDLARVREIAATETDPVRSALAVGILAKNGDQEAIERLVRIAAKDPKTIASSLLFDLEPDRAMTLLRLARWGDAAGADQASRVLATLLRRPADGEAALGVALRDAAPDELPRWMDVVAGYRIVPRTIATVLVGFLANGSAEQRASLRSFRLESPQALQEVGTVVAPQIPDLAKGAADADIGVLLRFTDLAADAGRDIGRGLLTLHLRSRTQDSLGDGMRMSVASWMARRYPEVATIAPERSQSMLTALQGPDAASFLLGVLGSDDRNEILFACRRVLRGGPYDAAAFARPLLAWAYRADKEVAAAAASALEGLREWPPELARSAARDLRRLVDDERELVSLAAAHALPSLPGAEEEIREYLGRVSEAPENDGAIMSALLDGLLDQPSLLADEAIAERVLSLFSNERARIALPVRRRIIASVSQREDGQPSAEEAEAARSVFPLRRRTECADWMADAEIRNCALAILNRVEVPTVADGVAICWAMRDPQVSSRAQDIHRRPEWIAAAEQMSRADSQRFDELVW